MGLGGCLGFSLSRFWNIFIFQQAVMSRECVFDNMGTDFSSLEILQEPEVCEDQLKKRNLRYLKSFWWLILICIYDSWAQNITFFDGWQLHFRLFDSWQLTPVRASNNSIISPLSVTAKTQHVFPCPKCYQNIQEIGLRKCVSEMCLIVHALTKADLMYCLCRFLQWYIDLHH